VGAFAKLQKKLLLAFLSVRVEQLGYHWRNFHEI